MLLFLSHLQQILKEREKMPRSLNFNLIQLKIYARFGQNNIFLTNIALEIWICTMCHIQHLENCLVIDTESFNVEGGEMEICLQPKTQQISCQTPSYNALIMWKQDLLKSEFFSHKSIQECNGIHQTLDVVYITGLFHVRLSIQPASQPSFLRFF